MVSLEDFKTVIGDESEITKLDMYLCIHQEEVEHVDIPTDQLFDEIASLWHHFNADEKVEILGLFKDRYESEL